MSASFPLHSALPPTPRSVVWYWEWGAGWFLIWPQGKGPPSSRGYLPPPPPPPPTAGQRATESQKQLLSPEHSSCAWISFPALLPEQRPGLDGVGQPLTPRHTLFGSLWSLPLSQVPLRLEVVGIDIGERGLWSSLEPGVTLTREVGLRAFGQGCNGGESHRAGPPQPAARYR